MLVIAVVLQTGALGVARAHQTSHASGIDSSCRHDDSVQKTAPMAPQSGNHHDCLLCQQCVGGSAFDEIMPFPDQGLAHGVAVSGGVRAITGAARAKVAAHRAQQPRAPPRGA
jgi:hypothetical protein